MGHVLEHVAIELQCLAGTPVTFDKTRGAGETGVHYVVYSFQQEEVGLEAGRPTERLLRALLPANLPSALSASERAAFNFILELEELAALADRVALGPSTGSLVKAAEARDIPWIRLEFVSMRAAWCHNVKWQPRAPLHSPDAGSAPFRFGSQ